MRFQYRSMLIALAIFLSVFQVIAQYSVTLPYKQVTVQNVNDNATFSGASIAGNVGQPALPVYKVTFLLPPDADLSTVSAVISNSSGQMLSNQYTVAPVPKIPGIETAAGAVIVNGKDTGIYRKNAFFPSDYKGAVQTSAMQQYKFVSVTINPYQYNPVTKKLRMISGGTLKVTFKGGASVPNSSRSSEVEKTLKSKVVNPELFDYYGAASTAKSSSSTLTLQSVNTAAAAANSISGCSYLIITTQSIVNNSPALTYYSNTLTSGGAVVTTATEGTWNQSGATTADQKANNLRTYIRNFYNSHINSNPLKYVLLIGNPNTVTGDVPMKIYNSRPTDYYYAELSQATTLDQAPEVAVGRIPMYDTDWNKLSDYLYRVMFYKVSTNTEWRRKALTGSEAYGFGSGYRESHELCEDALATLTPKGFSSKRMYHTYAVNCDEPFLILPGISTMNPLPDYTSYSSYHLSDVWNSETPGFVFLASHGAWYGPFNLLQTAWEGAYPPNVQNLQNNGYPAMVFAASCSTIKPDSVNNCGASTLFQTAIGYVGSTFDISPHENMAIDFTRFIGENYSVGDALNAAKTLDGNSDHCAGFNIYGCPEVSLDLPAIGNVGAPSTFKAQGSATEQKITLTWTTVPGVDGWNIERNDVQSTAKIDGFADRVWCSKSAVSFTDRDIVPGTVYRYRIYANDVNGNRGPYSEIDSSTSFYGITNLSCGTPTNLTVTSTHSNMVNLSWTGAANAAYYNVKRSTSANGPFVRITDLSGNNPVSTSLTDYNAINGNTYYYTVSAVNQYGQSSNSNVVAATPSFDLAPPVITGISESYDTNNTLITTITWQSNLNNEVRYRYEWALKFPDGTYGMPNGFGLIFRGATSIPFSNIGYSTNTDLVFRMRGYSDDGQVASAYSDYFDFTSNYGPVPLLSLSTPTNLTATVSSSTSIDLNWNYNVTYPSLTPESYEVYYKENGGTWYCLATTNVKSYTFTGAIPNTTYTFCVRALAPAPDNSGIYYYGRFTPVATVTIPSDPCFEVQGGGSGLNGTVFGLSPAWAAGSEYCKATDGNTGTYYDYAQANGGITGLDLGMEKQIRQIRFYPRASFASRMVGGKFQGSNTSSSSDFVDLYTISSTPASGWNTVTISNNSYFRWVRYLAPNNGYGNIAEMEFYAPVSQYTINASAGSNGAISPSGNVKVNGGASQVFTITPNSGYNVSAVLVDGINQGGITSYTFSNVTANHTILVDFVSSSTTFPDPTKWYKIATRANTNQCLDVSGGNYANNTAIQIWNKSNTNQEFQFKNAGNGYYTITCRGNTNFSIDMGGNFANNQTLKLWTTNVNNANQKFKLVPITGGYYRIETSNAGFSIDNTGNTGNGVKPYLWTSSNTNTNQQWVITAVP